MTSGHKEFIVNGSNKFYHILLFLPEESTGFVKKFDFRCSTDLYILEDSEHVSIDLSKCLSVGLSATLSFYEYICNKKFWAFYLKN